MADNSDDTDDKTPNTTIDMNEVHRDFKRLKVDESVATKRSVGDHHDLTTNYFTLNRSPYSPKISGHERRQSVSGLRRQRPHSLTTKLRHNSHNGLDVKSSKTPTNEDESADSTAKDTNICTDFKDLSLKSTDKCLQNDNYLYFNKHFKVESNDWRHRLADIKDKKCTNISEHNMTVNKVKTNKVKKLRINSHKSCARQALCDPNLTTSHPSADASVEELAAYFDDTLYLPRKMSFMAESIYS